MLIPLQAQTVIQNVYGRNHLSLNGKWQIIINWYDIKHEAIGKDMKPTGKTDFVEFDFSDAMQLQVPGDWNSQLPELKYYEGTVCYKRVFDYSRKQGNRIFLHFGAVNYQAEAYLNGVLLGSHEGGFTPFQFDITDQLKATNNVLVVIVNNQRHEDAIPALNYGWWNYGGITRDVLLVETPPVYVEDYFIQLEKGTTDQIKGWIKLNGASAPQQVKLEIPEAKIHEELKTNESGYTSFSLKRELFLWSPANPKLYKVKISTPEETVEDEIGFRSVEVKGTDILLNKQSVFLKGINIHEEIPERMGRACSEADAHYLLGLAKELDCNFIRFAHYPVNEYLVRIAEQMGMLVWEEIPLWQRIQFSNPQVAGKAEQMLAEMVARDKNRCNVIIWSVSNETRPGPERNDVTVKLLQKARELDSTRLVSAAISHFKYNKNEITVDDPICQYMDVIGINNYLGWYYPWPSEPGDINWVFEVEKPVIYSEFGAEALYGNHGSADVAHEWNEEYQENVYKANIAMLKNIPALRGVSPWLLMDYRDPTRLHPVFQDGWNRKGVLSDKGDKKKAWYVLRKYYDSIPCYPQR
jgi:beta-glucuronidase